VQATSHFALSAGILQLSAGPLSRQRKELCFWDFLIITSRIKVLLLKQENPFPHLSNSFLE